MKNSKKALLCLLACALAVTGCKTQKEPAVADNAMLVRSTQTLDSLYAHYSAPGTCLLRENYPSDVEGYTATYLASEEQKNRPNLYSYLWPYSGTFSAVNALMEATKDNKKDFGNYQKLLDEKVLPGLAEYLLVVCPKRMLLTSRTLRCPTAFTMTTCGSALTSQTSI